MTSAFVAVQILGAMLCLVAAVWGWRTRHQRRVWRNTRHDTARVAIVLELEEKVHELEQRTKPTVDAR